MHAAAMIANDTLSGAPQSLKPTVKPKKPTVKPTIVHPTTTPPGKPPIKKQRKRKSQTSAKALKEETEWSSHDRARVARRPIAPLPIGHRWSVMTVGVKMRIVKMGLIKKKEEEEGSKAR
jgi:hypothetical protein